MRRCRVEASEALALVGRNFNIDLDQPSPIEIPNVNRKELARLFRRLNFRVGAEIGVESGSYSKNLCKCNPRAKVYLVDAWMAYKGYRDHVTQSKIDSFYEQLRKRLEGFGNYEIIRKFSMEAVKGFEDESLDFVYIDANHQFEFVAQDIGFWSRKVKRGGIVSGHDFIRREGIHVIQAVQAYTYCYGIEPWFLLGRQAKVPGEVRDTSRSWFWVKP